MPVATTSRLRRLAALAAAVWLLAVALLYYREYARQYLTAAARLWE